MRASLWIVITAASLLGSGACKRKAQPKKGAADVPVARTRPAPMDFTAPRPGILRPMPPPATDAGAPRPTGPAPRWTWLPSNKYLCTRYGPAWKPVPGQKDKYTYDKPFALTYPKGKLLRLNLHAKGRDRSGVTYEAIGLPKGATFDAKRGRLKWTVDEAPGRTFQVKLVAKAGNGARAEWPLVLSVATEAQAAAWKAGLGNDKPHCDDRFVNLSITHEDLNGDGKKDVMWTYVPIIEGQPTDAYFHAVHLASGAIYEELSGKDLLEESRSSMSVVCAPGGIKLLQFINSCCLPEVHEYIRIQGTKAVSVGSADIDDSSKGSIRLTKDAQGCITTITVREHGTQIVLRWKGGRYL